METIDDGEGRGDRGERGGGIFVVAAEQEAQDVGPRARGGSSDTASSGSRAAVVGGMSRVAVIGGESRAAVIGGMSPAVILAVIVPINPLAEMEKAR